MHVYGYCRNVAWMLHTCNIHATSYATSPATSPTLPCNIPCNILCNVHTTCAEHACNMRATYMEYFWNMHETYIQHTCNTHATHYNIHQHACNICATSMQHVWNWWASNELLQWQRNMLQTNASNSRFLVYSPSDADLGNRLFALVDPQFGFFMSVWSLTLCRLCTATFIAKTLYFTVTRLWTVLGTRIDVETMAFQGLIDTVYPPGMPKQPRNIPAAYMAGQ